MELLTPWGALVGLALLAPLAALAASERRARRARAALDLSPPRQAARLAAPGAVLAAGGLLALAAAQPVLSSSQARYARADAQAVFCLDTSRSMLAAPAPGAPARIDRAKALALRLRAALADVPAGVVSFTDRALPHLFPSGSGEVFRATVERAVGVDRPPPRSVGFTATTFEALARAPAVMFGPQARRRLLVVLTDGESRDFDAAALGEAYRAERGLTVVVVRVAGAGEHVFGPDGRPEPGYLPPGPEALERFRAATGARVVPETEPRAALAAARAALGQGRSRRVAEAPATTHLARYLVLAALSPLALLLWRRSR